MPIFHVRVICRDCDIILADVTRTVTLALGGSTAVVEAARRGALDAIIESHENCERIETECEEIVPPAPKFDTSNGLTPKPTDSENAKVAKLARRLGDLQREHVRVTAAMEDADVALRHLLLAEAIETEGTD